MEKREKGAPMNIADRANSSNSDPKPPPAIKNEQQNEEAKSDPYQDLLDFLDTLPSIPWTLGDGSKESDRKILYERYFEDEE